MFRARYHKGAGANKGRILFTWGTENGRRHQVIFTISEYDSFIRYRNKAMSGYLMPKDALTVNGYDIHVTKDGSIFFTESTGTGAGNLSIGKKIADATIKSIERQRLNEKGEQL